MSGIPSSATAPVMDAGGHIPRNNSSRFVVDKVTHGSNGTEEEAEHGENGKAMPETESAPGAVSKGRFAVSNTHDATAQKLDSPATHKAVHFSVTGDADDSLRHPSTEGYATHNLKSFRNVETVERVPHLDHYRNVMSIEGAMAARPTLQQLHEESPEHNIPATLSEEVEAAAASSGDLEELANLEKGEQKAAAGPKFGWIQGVLVRCMLNILGVMLYLRLTWVAGQAGIGLGTLIVLMASVVTTLTTISMCAISTNGEIKGGGCYFMISRSLGPEFGGSIGLVVFLANAVGAAMYIVGFAETVRDTLKEEFGMQMIDGHLHDVRVVGTATAVILICICLIGTGFESKMQVGLLFVLAVSIVNYIVGTFLPPDEEQQAKGFVGYNSASFTDNFGPDFRDGYGFFDVFSIFFPAATGFDNICISGIMAGANISGDLADPQGAIPKGTFLAIFITTIIYTGAIWMSGAGCIRDASGLLSDLTFNNGSGVDSCLMTPANATEGPQCGYGLMNYFGMMDLQSAWGPLILAGIVAATLSSALASFVSAPKVFQAVCKDQLFPGIHVFAKGYGKGDEPRRAYALTFLIAVAMILIGDLNAIAPIISNFFLASYALINYAVFDASHSESPGFRPGFKYYNKWLSLGGAALCVGVMFVISWWTALLTAAVIVALFSYIHHSKPDVNWGSSNQANAYKAALSAMQKLAVTEEHVKNYRPQILALCGNPCARPAFVDFVSNVTKDSSLLLCGHVVLQEGSERLYASLPVLKGQISAWLHKRKVKAFYVPVANPSLREGARSLMQLSGMGKLRPNILMLGFKQDWRETEETALKNYVGIIHDAFDANMGVGVLRLPQGLDLSDLMKEYNVGDTQNLKMPEARPDLEAVTADAVYNRSKQSFFSQPFTEDEKSSLGIQERSDSVSSFAGHFTATPITEAVDEEEVLHAAEDPAAIPLVGVSGPKKASSPPVGRQNLSLFRGRHMSKDQKELIASINQFQRKTKKGVIDVWWLFDDGGLALLLPHILTQSKSYLEDSKLRVFTIAASRGALEAEQRQMAALLAKFRIDYTDVFVIPDIAKKPSKPTLAEWDALIQPLKGGDIAEAELRALKEKTYRQLRTKELLLQHSQDATLIVLTLPVPRKGGCSAALYMAWLEMITKGLPPTLLLRGNQQSVLTFYS